MFFYCSENVSGLIFWRRRDRDFSSFSFASSQITEYPAPVVQIFRNHQEAVGTVENLRLRLADGRELVDRVENLLLDAAPAVELRFRYRLVDDIIHALRAAVAIRDRTAEHIPLCVEQYEIHTPRIDADARRDTLQALALPKARDNFVEQAVEIPAKMAVALFQPFWNR